MRSEAPVCFMQIMGSAHNMFGSVNVLTVRSGRCSEDSPAGEPQLPILPRISLCALPARWKFPLAYLTLYTAVHGILCCRYDDL